MNNIVYNNKNYIIYQSSKYNENKPIPPFHDDKKMLTISKAKETDLGCI